MLEKQLDILDVRQKEEVKVINQIYNFLRLYTNFFQPQMKLIEKVKIRSKVKKSMIKQKHLSKDNGAFR